MGRFGSAEGLPLTAAQSGMWFAQELDPDNACFRAAEVVEIRGPVDVGLLERALRQAVAETDAFRVRFVTDEEERVRQVVEPSEDWPLPVLDLRGERNPRRPRWRGCGRTTSSRWTCAVHGCSRSPCCVRPTRASSST